MKINELKLSSRDLMLLGELIDTVRHSRDERPFILLSKMREWYSKQRGYLAGEFKLERNEKLTLQILKKSLEDRADESRRKSLVQVAGHSQIRRPNEIYYPEYADLLGRFIEDIGVDEWSD